MKKSLLIFLLIQLLANACSWDNEETLYPEQPDCDTENVSYQQDIVPLLTNSCYSCHSNVNAPDFAFGIALEDYGDVVALSEEIVATIKYEEGYPPMPRGADQLDSCSINKIEAWHSAGTPDN